MPWLPGGRGGGGVVGTKRRRIGVRQLAVGRKVFPVKNTYKFLAAATCAEPDLDAVRHWIAAGANVNAQRGAALRAALEVGNTELVELLLDSGASVNCDKTFLLVACRDGDAGLVSLLLARGARPGDTLKLLLMAVGLKTVDVLCALVKGGIGIEKHGAELVVHALRRGRDDVALFLLDHGVDPNAATRGPAGQPATLLTMACAYKRWRVAIALVEKGADVNGADGRALMFCAEASEDEVAFGTMVLLLDTGADPNLFDGGAMRSAAFSGSLLAMKLLANAGFDMEKHRASVVKAAKIRGRSDHIKLAREL